jgi:integrase
VTLPDGLGGRRDILLGEYGTSQSRSEYARVISEWEAAGRMLPQFVVPKGLSVNELILAFWQHAEQHYRRPDGTSTQELGEYKRSLALMKGLYGHTLASDFGPLALKAMRKRMIETGWCRGVINQRVGRIRRLFRWATSEQLVPVAVYEALRAVEGLKRGRSMARETEPIKPVQEVTVNATLPFLRPQVAAMVKLQLLTGMRPGEVVVMRTIDLDTTGKVWLYRPGSDQGPYGQHKTAWRDQHRAIFIGPKGQEILRPWLRLNLSEYLFQPKEAEAARDAHRRRLRKTKLTPSQSRRRPKTSPRKAPGDFYAVTSYAHAIRKGCLRAGLLVRVTGQDGEPLTAVKVEGFSKTRLCRHAPGVHYGRLMLVDESGLKILEKRLLREMTFAVHGSAQVFCDGRASKLDNLQTAIPFWHPNQLRHTKATEIRREAGLDAARVVLGHRSPQITETYAEIDVNKAAEVMAKLG